MPSPRRALVLIDVQQEYFDGPLAIQYPPRDDALAAIRALSPYDLEYVEQPCATVEELAQLRMALARNGIDVLIAADESIRKADDPLRVKQLGAADVAVLMTLFKLARLKANPGNLENWTDGCGYLACGGELATEAQP